MLGLKLIHVSKRGLSTIDDPICLHVFPRFQNVTTVNKYSSANDTQELNEISIRQYIQVRYIFQ